MHASSKTTTCQDLHAAVGSFLFCWSLLEQGLTRAIHDAEVLQQSPPSRVQGGLVDRIGHWFSLVAQQHENRNRIDLAEEVRAQCLALREVRNLIVHGLMAADASQTYKVPHISCALGGYEKPESERVHYTLEDLDAFTQASDACRRAFIDLDHFNFRLAKLTPVELEA